MYLRFTITSIPNVNHFRPWRLFKKSKVSLWRNSLNRILQPSEHNRRVVWDEQIQLSVREKKSTGATHEKGKSTFLCICANDDEALTWGTRREEGRYLQFEVRIPHSRCHWHFMGSVVIRRWGGVRGSTEVSPSLLTLINESVLSLTLFFAYLYFSLLRFCKFALCSFFPIVFSSVWFFYCYCYSFFFPHQYPIARTATPPTILFTSFLIRQPVTFALFCSHSSSSSLTVLWYIFFSLSVNPYSWNCNYFFPYCFLL